MNCIGIINFDLWRPRDIGIIRSLMPTAQSIIVITGKAEAIMRFPTGGMYGATVPAPVFAVAVVTAAASPPRMAVLMLA